MKPFRYFKCLHLFGLFEVYQSTNLIKKHFDDLHMVFTTIFSKYFVTNNF